MFYILKTDAILKYIAAKKFEFPAVFSSSFFQPIRALQCDHDSQPDSDSNVFQFLMARCCKREQLKSSKRKEMT